MDDTTKLLDELFPFTYVGTGYFRLNGVPAGSNATDFAEEKLELHGVGDGVGILHGRQAVEFLFAKMIKHFDKWQPIETHPKDDEDFLGWSAKRGIEVCCWTGHSFMPDVAALHQELTGHAQWREPTHWMPIPPSPEVGQ